MHNGAFDYQYQNGVDFKPIILLSTHKIRYISDIIHIEICNNLYINVKIKIILC